MKWVFKTLFIWKISWMLWENWIKMNKKTNKKNPIDVGETSMKDWENLCKSRVILLHVDCFTGD